MLSQALKKIIERAGSVIIVEQERPAYVVMNYADYEVLVMGVEQPNLWKDAAPQPPQAETAPSGADRATQPPPYPVDVSAISLDDLPF